MRYWFPYPVRSSALRVSGSAAVPGPAEVPMRECSLGGGRIRVRLQPASAVVPAWVHPSPVLHRAPFRAFPDSCCVGFPGTMFAPESHCPSAPAGSTSYPPLSPPNRWRDSEFVTLASVPTAQRHPSPERTLPSTRALPVVSASASSCPDSSVGADQSNRTTPLSRDGPLSDLRDRPARVWAVAEEYRSSDRCRLCDLPVSVVLGRDRSGRVRMGRPGSERTGSKAPPVSERTHCRATDERRGAFQLKRRIWSIADLGPGVTS